MKEKDVMMQVKEEGPWCLKVPGRMLFLDKTGFVSYDYQNIEWFISKKKAKQLAIDRSTIEYPLMIKSKQDLDKLP